MTDSPTLAHMPAHDSIALPASIRDLEHWVSKYAYRNQGRRELSIFSHAGRMYVCRDEDVERLRACLYEDAVARWAKQETEDAP
jgi:hypothetical protein